jgi:hypothetical protein
MPGVANIDAQGFESERREAQAANGKSFTRLAVSG